MQKDQQDKCSYHPSPHKVITILLTMLSFPSGSDGKASVCNAEDNPWVGKIPWRRKWQPTPGFLPGKSHGLRSLVGYCPWGRKESDTTERLHFTVSLGLAHDKDGEEVQCILFFLSIT